MWLTISPSFCVAIAALLSALIPLAVPLLAFRAPHIEPLLSLISWICLHRLP